MTKRIIPFVIDCVDEIGHPLNQDLEPLLALGQGRLHLPAVGEIGGDSNDALGTTVELAEGSQRRGKRTIAHVDEIGHRLAAERLSELVDHGGTAGE